MDLKQAIKILEAHNRWRRGEDVEPMVEPSDIGIAIDTLIYQLKNNSVLDDVSGSKKKRIRLLVTFDEFEEFVNSDIDIISLDIKAVEPSFRFQDGFNAVVYYR